MKKRGLLKMRLIMFASIMLVAGFFLLFPASNSLAATYTVDISSPTAGVTYLADFTSQGFDPSTEQVISGSLYLMVKASYRDDAVSFTIRLENNEHEQIWVDDRYYRALSLTLEDFTLIDEDGTIEYIVTTYSGWGYIGAGAFTIETSPKVTDGDGDGYDATVDCDDTDAAINPGATEACNGIDDNCDGEIDEGEGDIGDACHVYDSYTWMTDILQCPRDGTGGVDADSRGIRFTVDHNFSSVELRMEGHDPGTYVFDAELRRSTGFETTPEQTLSDVTIDVSGEEQLTPFTVVRLNLDTVAVSEPTTFTLKFSNVSGNLPLLFEAFEPGSDVCNNIAVTEDNFGSNPKSYSDVAGFRVMDETFALTSPFSEEPPNLDGNYGVGEWPVSIGNRIDLQNGFMRVTNDSARLYVVIDLTEDPGDDAFDSFELTFDIDGDGLITPGVDLNYTLYPGRANIRYQYYLGAGALSAPLEPETFSSMARGFGCFFGDGSRIMTSPPFPSYSYCSPHRFWEIAIDLKEINALAGDTIRMGVGMVSVAPFFSEDIPLDFTNDFSGLISIELSPDPVDNYWPDGDVILEDDFIEVTQATQHRDNSLPLVQDKNTVARVYAQSDAIDHLPRYSLVSLFAKKDGVDLPGSPMTQYHLAPSVINRELLNDTANFKLPSTWDEGDVEFSVVVRGAAPGTMRVDSIPLNLTFTQRKIPLYWNIPLNSGTADVPEVSTSAKMTQSESYLKTVFPVADVTFIRKPWQDIGIIINDMNAAIADLNDYYSAIFMGWMFGAIATGEYPFDLPDQIIGTTAIALSGFGGVSDPTWWKASSVGKVSWAVFVDPNIDTYMTHEINHNLDKAPYEPDPNDTTPPIQTIAGTYGRHVGNPQFPDDPDWGCGGTGGVDDWPWTNSDIQEIGFDTRKPWVSDNSTRTTVVPGTFPEFMSYCSSPNNQYPDAWISPYRWQKLFDFFETVEPAGPVATASFMKAASSIDLSAISDMYYISGYINVDGTGSLKPIVTAPGDTSFPSNIDGQYALRFIGTLGEILQEATFNTPFVDVEGNDIETASFNFRMPVIVGRTVASIELTKNEDLLDSISVSANPPQITLLSPNGGEIWNGTGMVNWNATDSDNDPLAFSLYYSPDNGRLWKPIALNIQASAFDTSHSFLPGGLNALIRVIATDGFHTAIDDSDQTFTVAQNPPEVEIISPETGDIFSASKNITFCGDATDREDEVLPEDAFFWFLNGKALGQGRCIDVILPAGMHDITLKSTDSNGAQNEDTITIEAIAADIFNEDLDGDGILDPDDNCPLIFNPSQSDLDGDGLGDVCDPCDNRPIEGSISSSTYTLWPPNHEMVSVNISGSSLTTHNPTQMSISSVGISEYSRKRSGVAAGNNIYSENNFEPDYMITGDMTVDLRSERVGASQGRTYTITVTATDCSDSYDFTTQVEVPHDQ